MAPEQAAGAPVGPAADVYALGAVLRHVAGDSLPPALGPLVDAALAPEPGDRPSAADLQAQLAALNAGVATEVAAPTLIPTQISPAAPAQSKLRFKPAVLTLAALAVIVMLVALFPRGGGSSGVDPVPAGADPAQTARNLATWLRDQAVD
jgi:hypothetical protein